MAPNTPRYARILTATLAIAGLVLAAIPATLADPSMRDESAKKHARDAERSHRPERPGHAFAISLEGNGTDKDNNTYKVIVSGEGRGKVKTDENGTVVGFRGIAHLRILVESENGTVVKDRELRTVVRGHLTDDGWVWKLHGFGKREHGLPQLHLRGTATNEAPGVFELDGAGRAAFAKTIPGPSLRMKIDEMSGSITRLS